ncbi:nucleotidyltransferase substrate binding protein [Alkalimarinus coralli]|uniref:nucleotidyltransferase substrate binding protein n=1 Tax=Alkalimarinus coralli TaxID=2935863 RepID=UPI00202AEDBF|nr:nucleotidyltransferase substrate binding protein [Alkalimarinus coralli]
MSEDVRWKQRFSNFNKALAQLTNVVELNNQRPLTDIERQGLIKSYEFTYELAWNVMKDYFLYQGTVSITGSRDAIREAFLRELIVDGESWMKMVADRNKTAHTYNEDIAKEVEHNILTVYYELFVDFQTVMNQKCLMD